MFFKHGIYHFLRFIGVGLTSLAMAAIMFVYAPYVNSDFVEAFLTLPTEKSTQEVIRPSNNSQALASHVSKRNKFDTSPEKKKFTITIPTINAEANVIANVDPFDKNEYKDALKRGVAHAEGTYFPGEGKTIYLFAHSTDSIVNVANYNAVFYQLKKLTPKDRIYIHFGDFIYVYEVSKTVIVEPSDTSWLNPKEGEELVLQTCDPPGTTRKRLLVIAKRAS